MLYIQSFNVLKLTIKQLNFGLTMLVPPMANRVISSQFFRTDLHNAAACPAEEEAA
jgi:hypothetical protein